MKSFVVTAATASILLGLCLFVSGCGGSPANKPKMETSGGMMSSEATMSGSMMSDGKMSTTDKMSDPKMNDMAEGKMENSEAPDK